MDDSDGLEGLAEDTDELRPPMDGLERSVAFEITRADPDSDGFNLEGYAAVFDSPTTIDSWEGKFVEQIARGAFKKTMREQTPTLMFDHGQHPLVGNMPIGVIRAAREDDKGLFVRSRLSNNWLVEPVRQAIADGAITGWSFRFSVVRDDWARPADGGIPQRTLKEVSVRELGPVVFPAYRETSLALRSIIPSQVRSYLATELGTSLDEAAFDPEPVLATPFIRSLAQRRALVIAHGV